MSLPAQVQAWRRQRRLQLAADGGVRLAPLLLWGAAALWLLDAVFFLPQEPRLIFFAVLALLVLRGFLLWVFKPQWKLEDRGLLRQVGLLSPGLSPYLLSGWELGLGRVAPGVSEELAQAHVEQAERALGEHPVEGLFPPFKDPKSAKRLGQSFAALLALAALGAWRPAAAGRVFLPWKDQPLEALLELMPGSLELPWGKPAQIKAVWRGKQEPGLELWVRSPSSPWRRQDWDEPYAYRISGVTEALDYRLRWRGLHSSDYRLKPVSYPQLNDLRLTLRYPVYTGLSPVTYDRAQDLEALEGSLVEVSGQPDRPLASAVLRASNLPMALPFSEAKGGRLQASFRPSGEGTYHWELEDPAGLRDPSPVLYRFQTLKDQPPTVDVLSPGEEIEASPREPLRITFEASDDYGLEAVEIRWNSVTTGRKGEKVLLEAKDHPKRYLGDLDWDLKAFVSGSVLEYRLRALDGRGQWGESRKGTVKITDFEGQHEALRKELAQQLLDLKELDSREKVLLLDLNELSTMTAEMSSEMQQDRQTVSEQWQQAADKMEALSQKMEQDPLSNPGLQMQYKQVAEMLRDAQKTDLPKAEQSLNRKDWEKAKKQHQALQKKAQQAADALQKGEKLQDIQDASDQAERMEAASRDMEQKLSQMAEKGGKPSSEDEKKLAEALSELAKQMEELAQQVSKLPQQDSGKADPKNTLDLADAQDLASKLAQDLKKGDLKKALADAKKLADMLSKVRKALSKQQEKSAEDMVGPNPYSKQMAEAEKDWEQLIEDQQNLVEGLSQMEDKRIKDKLEAQKKMLQDLADQQKVLNSSSTVTPDAAPLMEAVERQLREGRLQDVETRMRMAAGRLSQRPDSQALAQEQLGLLQKLQQGAQPPPDAQGMQRAADRQGQLKGKAGQLQQKLEGLPMPGKSGQSLGQAGDEMGQGQGSLSQGQGEQGLGHASKALELLEKGLENQREEMQKQGQMEGGFMPSQRMTQGSSGQPRSRGRTGVQTGFVELPSAKDYRPPVELRQEIMRSLQERYPRSYEGVIKDYLKRLSQ